jgi:hypothetical protein
LVIVRTPRGLRPLAGQTRQNATPISSSIVEGVASVYRGYYEQHRGAAPQTDRHDGIADRAQAVALHAVGATFPARRSFHAWLCHVVAARRL